MTFLLLISVVRFSGNEKLQYFVLDRNKDYIDNTFFINIRQKPITIHLKSLIFIPPQTNKYKSFIWKRLNGKFEFMELSLGRAI